MPETPAADKARDSFKKMFDEVVDLARTVFWAVLIATVARTFAI